LAGTPATSRGLRPPGSTTSPDSAAQRGYFARGRLGRDPAVVHLDQLYAARKASTPDPHVFPVDFAIPASAAGAAAGA
jgi:hypothetical protein